VVALRLRSTP